MARLGGMCMGIPSIVSLIKKICSGATNSILLCYDSTEQLKKEVKQWT